MNPRSILTAACAYLLLAFAVAAAQTPNSPPMPDLATVHEEVGQLDCRDCHGAVKPKSATAEQALRTANQSCLSCHGTMANVAAKIAPKLSNKHLNPHASHVVSIACVTCHVAHDAPSKAYCLQCHNFDMPMNLGHQLKTQ